MNPLLKGKLRLLGELTIIGSFSGIIHQLVAESVVDHMAFLVGGVLGLCFGIMELFVLSRLQNSFLKLPLFLSILIKSVGYILVIYIIQGLLGLFFGYFEGKNLDEFYESMVDIERFTLIIYTS